MSQYYYIVRKDNPHIYWDIEDGWVTEDEADIFDEFERSVMNLPENGEWKGIL